ncbi:MAG TPA: glycosyltransferase, partial [Phycisphaerales bacterium]|nr:glycosyltransferase [Phycisphaerales bacterium]
RTGPDIPILVVVPAHNEAGTIGPLIRSLREQDHDRFHVVLALDRCTDGTAAVARREIAGDHRFEVVEIAECPEGWAGKVNAVRVGVEHSAFTPEMLLFTDADCVLHPACLRAASALAEDRSLDLLSFLSEYPPEAWFEYLVQPITGFELLRQYPLLRANRFDDRQRPFANGQFMLFRASFYRQIGGHAAVRDELLEDLALARAVKKSGGRAGALLGGGIVRCRMYETWDQFQRGWRRIFPEAAQRRSARLRRTGWRLRTMQTILPIASLLLGVATTWVCRAWGASPVPCWGPALIAGVGLFAYAVSMVRVFRMAGITPLAVPLAPFGAWLASGLLLRAADELAAGEPTVWAGRAYIRQDRSAGEGSRGTA